MADRRGGRPARRRRGRPGGRPLGDVRLLRLRRPGRVEPDRPRAHLRLRHLLGHRADRQHTWHRDKQHSRFGRRGRDERDKQWFERFERFDRRWRDRVGWHRVDRRSHSQRGRGRWFRRRWHRGRRGNCGARRAVVAARQPAPAPVAQPALAAAGQHRPERLARRPQPGRPAQAPRPADRAQRAAGPPMTQAARPVVRVVGRRARAAVRRPAVPTNRGGASPRVRAGRP